jgi:hypothetical protein
LTTHQHDELVETMRHYQVHSGFYEHALSWAAQRRKRAARFRRRPSRNSRGQTRICPRHRGWPAARLGHRVAGEIFKHVRAYHSR